jgi:hypothetical protein
MVRPRRRNVRIKNSKDDAFIYVQIDRDISVPVLPDAFQRRVDDS